MNKGRARRSLSVVTLLVTLVGTSAASVVAITAAATPAAADGAVYFPTDGCQSYTVPANVAQVDVEAVGGDGGPGDGTGNGGGKGGHVKARFDVNPGQTLYAVVGGNGGNGGLNKGGGARHHGGAGGDSLYGSTIWGSTSYGGGGGGASFVSTDSAHCGTSGSGVDANGVLLVAAGGGGGGAKSALGSRGGAGGDAGHAGGASDQDCIFTCSGGGNGGGAGTSSGGGGHGTSNGGDGSWLSGAPSGTAPNFLYQDGGSASFGEAWGGGGGGGWFGGGQGGNNSATFGGGGGGSNVVRGVTADINAVRDTGQTPIVTITPVNSRRLTVSTNGTGAGTVTSGDTPQTINCGTACKSNYTTGSTVTLTATPVSGSRFAGWSGGGCSGNASTCTVTMDVFQTVTATFNTLRAVTINKQQFGGQGDGTITSSPPGFLTCGSGCIDYDQGTSVTLTATPDSTSLFRGWETGGQTALASCQGQLTPCTFTPTDRDLTVYANFAQNVLTVGKNGAGSGTIVSSPTGISCGTTCSKLYPWGTQVTLVATPDVGSHFQWASYPCDTPAPTNTCTFTMDQGSRTIVGSFVKNQETLSVSTPAANAANPAFGNVTSSPAGINCQLGCGTTADPITSTHNYEQFSQVTLTATPRTGTTNDTTFTGWGGACAASGTSPTCTVTMDTAKSVTANFALIPHYTLTLAAPSPPGNGSGTITSGDSSQTINCGTTCSNAYYSGTQVTLTATPDSATSQFAGWGGACTNTTGTCTVTMSQAQRVTATFLLLKHTLSVSTNGTGTGKVTSTFFKSGGGIFPDESVDINCGTTCSGSYDHGDVVTLDAVEDQTVLSDVNSVFTGWSGACTNTTGSCQVTMDQARSVTATFARNSHELDVATSGVGTGTVTSDLAGTDGHTINCGTGCSEVYDTYTRTGGGGIAFTFVTLTATPTQADSRFTGWTGACAGNVTNQCSLTMDQARSTTATFDLNRLTVTRAGGGAGTVTSGDVPQTINCGAVCAANYPQNTQVTLTATPSNSPLSTFGAWTDGNGHNPCTNAQPQPTCVVTMAGARTVQATFTTNAHVHVVLAGTGAANGQVYDGISGGINCGAGNTSCDLAPVQGSNETLHANSSDASTTFDGWSGPCTGTGDCTFTANDAVTVTATFTLHTSTLSVNKTGTGGGTVTSSDVPSTISCGSTCTQDYPTHASGFSLTASPDANSDFIGWSGDCTPSGNVCRIADFSAARNVTAEFEPIPSYTLTVSPTGTGRGTVTSDVGGISCPGTCSASFERGTVVTLSETTDNSTFGGWGNGCNASAPAGECAVRLGGNTTISPSFTLKTIFLGVSNAFDTGSGTVTTQSGIPSAINCTVTGTSFSGTCGASFESGTNVTLTATPASNSELNTSDSTWGFTCTEGAQAQQTGVCTVFMDPLHPSGQFGTAKFTHNPVALNVDATGGTGTGSVSIPQANNASPAVTCSFQCVSLYPYQYGGLIVLTATPDSGNTFVSWTGCDAAPGNQCYLTGFQNDRSVKATFRPTQRNLQVRPGGSTGSGSITAVPTGVATGTPAGISSCTGTCNGTFDQASQVTLTATPSPGSQFNGWQFVGYSGSCPDTTCTLTIPAGSMAATANYSGVPRTITAAKDGTGTGTVNTVNAPLTSIACGSTCSGVWPNGIGITLMAIADPGSNFAGWTNCPNVLTPSTECRVNINSDLTVTATFNLPQRTLTVTPAGTGTGTVTSDVGSINCGTTCSDDYDPNTQVTLSASYDPTSTSFEGWSGTDAGACAGTTVDCTLTMDAAKSVTATFTTITHDLTVTPAGTGTGTVMSDDTPQTINCGTACTAAEDHGKLVTLTATPSPDSSFDGWSGDCTNTTGDCTVTMDQLRSVTATFTVLPVQQLSVSKAGKGSGGVTSSPAGIDCGSTCSYSFNSGSPVTLSASPTDSKSTFVGWSGDCTGTSTCQVTMDAAHSVTATFAAGTTTAVASTQSPSAVGQPVTFTATVAPVTPGVGTPTGSVAFQIDGVGVGTVPLSGGTAQYATSTLTARATTHTVVAVYTPDTVNFAGSTGALPGGQLVGRKVKQASTVTAVTAGPNPVPFGQPVTITAAVTPSAANGSIQFKRGTVNLGAPVALAGGNATLTINSLLPGQTITAVYSGSSNYLGSSGHVAPAATFTHPAVTGKVSGMTLSGGSWLVKGATVNGDLTIAPGTVVAIIGSKITGTLTQNPLSTDSGGALSLCGTSVGGDVVVSRASGVVLIGDAADDGCAANTLAMGLTLTGNTGGVELVGNKVMGSVTLTGNSGTGAFAEDVQPELEANTIGGNLACSGDSPAATNDGHPNNVTGTRSGECGAAGF